MKIVEDIQCEIIETSVTCEKDADERTNEEIKEKEIEETTKNNDIVSGTIRMVSRFTRRDARMRKRILCQIQSNSDVKVWTYTMNEGTITHAKIFNPAILLKKDCKIANFKNLQHLEVEDSEEILSTFPKSLVGSLRSLETFMMNWTRIRILPTNVYHHKLKHLIVQRNSLVHLNGISKASNLEVLCASNNCISELSDDLGNLCCLTELNLSNNQLKYLPESICSLTSLKILDCSFNKLQRLPSNIGNMIRLNTLDVSANQLQHLPSSIGYLYELIDLRVASNRIENFPDTFSNLNRLTSLNMRNNYLKEIPAILENLKNLKCLNLRDNALSNFDMALTSLTHLILNNNHFIKLSSKILDCCDLEYLNIQRNKLTSLPTGLSSLKKLKTLILSYNPIEDIPNEIALLTSLKHVDLSGTNIKTLPTSIQFMETLAYVNIDECQELDPILKLEYKNDGVDGLRKYLALKSEENRISTIKRQLPSAKHVESIYPIF